MKALKPWLALGCLALSACGPLEEMDIVPIKFAPVTVISSRVVPPAPSNTASAGSDQEIPVISGCWEYIPADETQPIIRRYFEQTGPKSYSYRYSAAEIQRVGSKLTQLTEKGSASYTPRQGQVLISANSRTRKEGAPAVGDEGALRMGTALRREGVTRNDEKSLDLDGLVYAKLDVEPCW